MAYYNRERIFQAYVAEGIRMLTVNVANGLMVENAQYLGKSYFDILDPKPESTETADEIIDRISSKLEGLNNGRI